MSRVVVKNLPENIKESRLRDIFSDYGEVTDIKLCFTKKGVFRKFAFVGYKKDEEAAFVLKALNKTFIDASKIVVEKCMNLGESPESRPWSKYSTGSSAYRKHTKEVEDRRDRIKQLQGEKNDTNKKKNKKKENDRPGDELKDLENDDKFQEFLALHSNKQEKQIWSNNENKLNDKNKSDGESKISDKEFEGSSSEEYSEDEAGDTEEKLDESSLSKTGYFDDDECVTLKMRGIPFKSKESDIINFFKPIKVEDIRFPINKAGKRTGYAFVDFKNTQDMGKAMQKDKEKMKGRYIELFEAPHKDSNVKKFKKESWKVTEDVSDTGRLFLRNLSYTCREEDLQELFSKYGDLVEVQLPIDKNSNRSTGYAFITFMMPDHAMKAWTELDGKIFQGRILHIIPGKAKNEEKDNLNEGSYKKKKEAEKKALSSNAHNWNSLFLGQNAVADVIAERLNKSKSDVLDGDKQSSVAVNMALGETELVNETRKFLESAGVNLDVFGQANAARSKNVILVKNLPAGTTQEEMSEIFSKHGDLGRVLMPVVGITAIIEFISSTDAKQAFLNLAYSKFKHTPLYLEWAPVDVLSGEVTKEEPVEKESESEEESGDDAETPEGTVIFVKNLNFASAEDKLKTIFTSCGKVKEATIAKKKDPKKPGAMLSMGYGFIKFKKVEDADKAIKILQGCTLDGHQLELKKSHRETIAPKASRKRAVNKKQTSSKIVVRNIPFEANEKEIRDLFSTFGSIKSVRLPKKMAGTGSHRGFAFVDFTTKQNAKRAFEALCLSTHLYGRRLVLEWAEDDESIDTLQMKTAQKYNEDAEPQIKKSKLISSLEKGSKQSNNEL